jgi:flagellar basal-body rod modification protein FlgD
MTQPVSSVATGLPVAPNPAIDTGDNTKLSSKAFLQLLVAQLQYQDPSKPVDTASFMNETATLTQVQSSEQTAKVSLDMLSAQRAQTASSLVGHTVSYTGADGQLVTGYVSAATISTAKPTLKIGTAEVDLTQIQQVLATGTP